MEQLLKTAQELVAELKRKNAILDESLRAVSAREERARILEAQLANRAENLTSKESAETILAQAKAMRNEAHQISLKNAEAKAALETAEATQRERFENARAEAASILAQAGDVKADRAKLEIEKSNYKAKILDEIKSKLG